MGSQKNGDRRRSGQGWLSTLVGVLVLTVGGFLIGLVVGVVSEEPELVAGHVAGRSTEIDWTAPGNRGDGSSRAGSWPDEDVQPVDGQESLMPPVAAAPRQLSGSPGQDFVIQVGAFADGVTARALALRLEQSGYPVLVMEPASDDRWRVRVGPLPARVEADQVALRLKSEERLPTWVLRHSGS